MANIHIHLNRKRTRDAYFNFDSWAKAVFAVYPKAEIKQERLAGSQGGFAKVAFVGSKVVGKYTFGGTQSNIGWVGPLSD